MTWNHIKDGDKVTKVCKYCEDAVETSGHIITECEAFWKERGENFFSFNLDPQSPNWTPNQLQGFLASPRVAGLEDEIGQPDGDNA